MYMYSLFIRIDFFAIQREESWKNAAARWKWAAVTKLPMAEQTHTSTHIHTQIYMYMYWYGMYITAESENLSE